MKSFNEYLTESKKTYDFKIKIAGELPEKFDSMLKEILEKYGVSSIDRTKTPIQKAPLDFPNVSSQEVNIFEICLEYPVTPPELQQYIIEKSQIANSHLVVRGSNEPSEDYQTDKPEAYIVKMSSPLENPNPEIQKSVGEAGKLSFLASLSKKEMTVYKGVNDELLADSAPSEKTAAPKKESENTKTLFSYRKSTETKGIRK